MAPPVRRHDLEQLLAGSRWVRALARGLVRDASSADDVVQDAWVVALSRPAAERDPGAWLAGVARHLARRAARSAARQRRREAAAARPEGLPSTDELVERSELQERLSAAVRALDEPYRTTVLLHYAEGLSLEEIAQSQGVPASTVRTRLARALERLRTRLDREHGDRATWLAALAPLASTPALPLLSTTTSVALGSLAMGAKTGLGIAAIAAGVAVLAVSIALRDGERGATPPSPVGGAAELAATAEREAAGSPQIQAPQVIERQPVPVDESPSAGRAALLLYGSLLTIHGEPVTEASISLWNDQGERKEATVAPGSWSTVGLAPGAWNVSVRSRSFYPLREELTLSGTVPETRHDLVLEPARVLRIRFVDTEGRTVIGADTRSHPLLPGLGAVATLAPPGPRIPGVDGRFTSGGDAGQYLTDRVHSQVQGLPADCAGLLWLTQPPPVYVSAVLRDLVLETRLDSGAGEELVFVLDVEALKSRLSALSLRLVDAATGVALAGSADLSFRDGGGSNVRAGEDGVIFLEQQIPGLRELHLQARDHVLLTRIVRLEPGETLDLGDVPLPPKRALEGRLVDEGGQPVAERFQVTSDDLVASPLDVERLPYVLIDGDGNFQLWNRGSGETWLLMRQGDYAVNPMPLETDAAGRATAIARRGTPVLLRHGRKPASELRFAIADAAGRPFWTRLVYHEAPIRLRLMPGSYQLLEGRDEVFTLVRTFEVGAEAVVLEP